MLRIKGLFFLFHARILRLHFHMFLNEWNTGALGKPSGALYIYVNIVFKVLVLLL